MTLAPYILTPVKMLEKELLKSGNVPISIKLDTDSIQIFVGITFNNFTNENMPTIHKIFSQIEKSAKKRYSKTFCFYIRPEEN